MIGSKTISVGRKLLSGSMLRVMNLAAAAVTAFFLMPFIVHHLGDQVYGFWSLATAFVGYYNLLDLGLSSAISQYMCIALGQTDYAECRVVFNTALRLQLLIGGAALAATLALVAITPLFCHHPAEVPLFRAVIAILGINAAIGFPARVYWATLEAELRFDIQAWLANLSLALRTGMVVVAILAGGGLLALAWTTLIATVLVTALQIWYARRQAKWARIDGSFVQKKRIKIFFSYSVYSFLAYIADVVRFQLDPVVIASMIGLAAVTHYKVAGIFAQYYLQVVFASVGMMLPVFSRLHGAGNRSRLDELFFFGTKLSCCMSVFICCALIGWGRPFIIRWIGASYLDGYPPLVVLSLAVLVDVSQRSSADLLFATFNQKYYAWINGAEAILNLAFSLALARPYGILGVAIGTFIGAFTIRVVLQPWWVCKVSGLNYRAYMQFAGGAFARCACLAALAIAVSVWGLRPNYFWMTSSAVFATAVYAAGSWFAVFNHEERQWFLAAIRRGRSVEQGELAAANGTARP
jgi:O-antigen/teichoic acid export membrane protein